MVYSTLTARGRATIPRRVRQALGLATGDRLEFVIEGKQVRLRKAAGAAALAGALASDRGRSMGFAAIRRAAAAAAGAGWNWREWM